MIMADAELEFLRNFGAGLDAAVDDRQLPNPTLASDNPNETDSSAYIRAIRARLIELGYLGEGRKFANRRNEKLDSILARKIRRFQKEAGIKEDGWAGPITWRVLECLVSFENQQNPDRWRKVWKTPEDFLSSKAVLRGVYCRLYAMGFFADWKRCRINTRTVISPSDNPQFQAAIEKFCRFAQELKLLPPGSDDLSVKMLIALYEYDEIVNRLGEENFYARASADFQDNIDAVARIELWLLGYDVVPGKDRSLRDKSVSWKEAGAGKKISATKRAIESFCADHKAAFPDFVQAENVSHELMAAFAQLSAEPEKDIYVGKKLNRTVDKILAEEGGRKEFDSQFKKIANGIFDGIRRVVRWLFRLVEKIVKFTRQFIANIVRCISRKARRFYLDIVKAFDIVYAGMTYLKASTYHYEHPVKIVYGRDRDFDQLCLISPGLPPGRVKSDSKLHGYRSKLYAAGMNIISHLMRMAQRVLKAVSSPVGWLLALLSLSNLANSVKAIRRQIRLVREYELDIEHQGRLFSTRIS